MDPSTFRYFFNAADLETEVILGDVRRVVYTSNLVQLMEYRFPPNKSMDVHQHDDHDQIGYVISGRIVLVIDGVERELGPGDIYHAPAGVPHGAWTLDEPAVMIDVFGPPRDDILEYSNRWVTPAEDG